MRRTSGEDDRCYMERETLEICDKAAILNYGKIIAKGEKDYLISNDEVTKVYLGNTYI